MVQRAILRPTELWSPLLIKRTTTVQHENYIGPTPGTEEMVLRDNEEHRQLTTFIILI